METRPIFNLFLTYEDALESAKAFLSKNETHNGEKLHIWEDPRDFYNQRMKFRLDGFFKESEFESDLKEICEVGTIEAEAKAALYWLIEKHKGFNPLELNQVIVGVMHFGLQGDEEVALFTYLSKADDCLRDFIVEKAYRLTDFDEHIGGGPSPKNNR